MPTVGRLRARRLELDARRRCASASSAGALDDVRVVVESLAEEFDVLDVAAAAVKMAHAAIAGEGGDREVEIPPAAPHVERPEVRRVHTGAAVRAHGPARRPLSSSADRENVPRAGSRSAHTAGAPRRTSSIDDGAQRERRAELCVRPHYRLRTRTPSAICWVRPEHPEHPSPQQRRRRAGQRDR